MDAVLAVDPGGTKCEAALVAGDGTPMGFGRWDFRQPGSGRGPGGSGRSLETIAHAVALAMEGAPAVNHLLVVGRHFPMDLIPATSRPRTYGDAHVSEPEGALALAGAQHGIVILAGTGAFVHGRSPSGQVAHLDSLGPLYGDHGSAFQIGLMAVRAVGKSDWHPRHQTGLVEPILRACAAAADNPPHFSIIDYLMQHRDRSEIAGLAEVVDRVAMEGDTVANRILCEAAEDIAETTRDVLVQLDMLHSDLPMVATGSVAVRSTRYWEAVCRAVARFAPRLRPHRSPHPAVYGLALAAMARYAPENAEGFRSNLLARLDTHPAPAPWRAERDLS